MNKNKQEKEQTSTEKEQTSTEKEKTSTEKKLKTSRLLNIVFGGILLTIAIIFGVQYAPNIIAGLTLKDCNLTDGGATYVRKAIQINGAKEVKITAPSKDPKVVEQYSKLTSLYFDKVLGRGCTTTLVIDKSDVIEHGDWIFPLLAKGYSPFETSDSNPAPLAQYTDKSIVFTEFNKVNADFAKLKGQKIAEPSYRDSATNKPVAKDLNKLLNGEINIQAAYTIDSIDWYIACSMQFENNPYIVISFQDRRFPNADVGYTGDEHDEDEKAPASSTSSSSTSSAKSSTTSSTVSNTASSKVVTSSGK